MRTVIFWVCWMALTGVSGLAPGYAQTVFANLEAQRIEARAKLRQAIIGLRDARMTGCKFSGGDDCQLAPISAVQLTLLDVESNAREAARAAANSTLRVRLERIQRAADEARQKVSDLEDEFKP